jgi:DNA-binding HxlR family transcriptional regulator
MGANLGRVSPEVKPVMLDGVRPCPIADALELVGDRWSLLVMREISFGVHRFNDIQRHTGMPRDRLAARLRALEQAGVITRRPYSEHPPRHEYLATSAGQALIPVLQALRQWGEEHAAARPGASGGL